MQGECGSGFRCPDRRLRCRGRTADALAQAIQKLADDKTLREQYGSAAAKRVAEEYEEKDVVDKVYATLKEVAERRQRK